jgi:hypothetical protein
MDRIPSTLHETSEFRNVHDRPGWGLRLVTNLSDATSTTFAKMLADTMAMIAVSLPQHCRCFWAKKLTCLEAKERSPTASTRFAALTPGDPQLDMIARYACADCNRDVKCVGYDWWNIRIVYYSDGCLRCKDHNGYPDAIIINRSKLEDYDTIEEVR